MSVLTLSAIMVPGDHRGGVPLDSAIKLGGKSQLGGN